MCRSFRIPSPSPWCLCELPINSASECSAGLWPASSGTVSVPFQPPESQILVSPVLECQRHSATKPWVDRTDLPRAIFPHDLNPEAGCAKRIQARRTRRKSKCAATSAKKPKPRSTSPRTQSLPPSSPSTFVKRAPKNTASTIPPASAWPIFCLLRGKRILPTCRK